MSAPARWPVRGPMLLGTLTTVLLLAGTFFWGMMTTITGAVVTSGQVEVEQNRQIVQHADGGIVAEILVSEGSRVAAGEVVLRLDGTLLQSEFAITEAQFLELLARRGRLEAERDGRTDLVFPEELQTLARSSPEALSLMEGQRALFLARADTQSQQISQLRQRNAQTRSLIEGLDAQKVALEQQSRLIDQELTAQQSLFDKGLAQVSRVLALQREAARLAGEMGELTASRAQAGERISETEFEILSLTAAAREEAGSQLRDIGYRELELAERRRALREQIARLDLRAPAAGVVLNLSVTTPRAVIRPAEPVLYIIPQDRPLVIATRVPNLHIDQVIPGQEVRVIFPAFSTRTTPELFGTIASVSADALTDEQTLMPYYRAEIVLNPGETAKLGQLTLLPGMPVDAYIRTEERTPLQFLTRPFTDYFTRAFRES